MNKYEVTASDNYGHVLWRQYFSTLKEAVASINEIDKNIECYQIRVKQNEHFRA